MAARLPSNETERLAVLRSYDILDMDHSQAFAGLVQLAALTAECPVAYISLVNEDKVLLKAAVGMPLTEMEREACLCAHTLLQQDVHEKLPENYLSIDGKAVRFYAGMPLLNQEGFALGTLCIMDTQVKALNEYQRKALKVIAAEAVNNFERRKKEKRYTMERNITQRMEHKLMLAKITAEEARRAQEIFLANMSHEIRTPMNGVMGMTNLLLNTRLTEEQLEYVSTIQESSSNLLVIINDILDISKIKLGKIVFEEVSFELAAFLKTTLAPLQVRAKEKKLALKATVDSDIPAFLVTDTVRLGQVLTNLLGNAIKFTAEGKIELNISLHEKRENDLVLEFAVKDSGIGIAPDKLGNIFESFVQASSDTTRKYGGTGLGLAIVKQLIELQGGNIQVQSTPGKGTTFTFLLPVKQQSPEAAEKHEERATAKPDLSGLKILVVEDNPVNQKVAQVTLQKWNALVELAGNGKEAIEKLEREEYDLVLMDLQMPQMDGVEATKRIRAEKDAPYRNVPIVAMTASALRGEREKCLAYGMNEYISKPFEPKELYRVIKSCTGQREDLRFSSPATGSRNRVDLNQLKELTQMDHSSVTRILTIYLNEMPKMMQQLDAAIRQKQWSVVKESCHKLKSSVGLLGMLRAFETLERMEGLALENDHEGLLSRFASVKEDCDASYAELRSYLRSAADQ